ncbi:hypothetical protein ACFFRR_004449 [Megaselia abdita]
MFSKVVLLCVAFFIGSASAADQCYFNNCQNSTVCTPEPVNCTREVALDSIAYLNTRFNNTVPTDNLSKKFNCFSYYTSNYVFFLDGTNQTTYTLYRSCITKNVDVCNLGKEEKSAYQVVIGASSGSGCGQCNSNLCNSSSSFVSSWKIIAIVSFLLFSGFSLKY